MSEATTVPGDDEVARKMALDSYHKALSTPADRIRPAHPSPWNEAEPNDKLRRLPTGKKLFDDGTDNKGKDIARTSPTSSTTASTAASSKKSKQVKKHLKKKSTKARRSKSSSKKKTSSGCKGSMRKSKKVARAGKGKNKAIKKTTEATKTGNQVPQQGNQVPQPDDQVPQPGGQVPQPAHGAHVKQEVPGTPTVPNWLNRALTPEMLTAHDAALLAKLSAPNHDEDTKSVYSLSQHPTSTRGGGRKERDKEMHNRRMRFYRSFESY